MPNSFISVSKDLSNASIQRAFISMSKTKIKKNKKLTEFLPFLAWDHVIIKHVVMSKIEIHFVKCIFINAEVGVDEVFVDIKLIK